MSIMVSKIQTQAEQQLLEELAQLDNEHTSVEE